MVPEITNVPIGQVRPFEKNPRKHPKKQIRQLKRSLKRFKWMLPILIDSNGVIIAGHGIYQAARELGLEEIPVIFVEHLSEHEIKAYRIADNKLAENSEWDNEFLISEISELLKFDVDFDIDLTGFSTPEIDVLVTDQSPEEFEEPVPTLPKLQAAVSRVGDIFQCGENRLGVGDVLDNLFVDQLMGGRTAQMACTDPPYNVPINGHASGKGQVHHDEFALACGEMSPKEFRQFLVAVLTQLSRISADGSLHYLFMDWRHLQELILAGNEVFDQFINLCVWTKTNAGMGALYRSQHELCLVFKKGKAPHVNNVELGKHGRNRTNVWSYAGMNSFGKGRDELLACHPDRQASAYDCRCHHGRDLPRRHRVRRVPGFRHHPACRGANPSHLLRHRD